jgi:hypothetical protein
MSFDTTFDYTDALNTMGNLDASCTSQIADIDAELADWGTIDGYDTIKTTAVAQLNQRKTACQGMIDINAALSTEIGNIETLASGSKNTLYDLYNTVSAVESVPRFMGRLIWQHADIEAEAAAFLADGNLSGAQKTMLGTEVLHMYPLTPDGEHISVYLQQLP